MHSKNLTIFTIKLWVILIKCWDDALQGKVIVVGGGSGLGKAMTKYFLELGAKVAITSRDIEKLKTQLPN
jgi:alanine dehydrogenase